MSLFKTSLAFSTWAFHFQQKPQIYNLWMVACLMQIFLIWKAGLTMLICSQICSHALGKPEQDLGPFFLALFFQVKYSFILKKIGIPVHLCRAPKQCYLEEAYFSLVKGKDGWLLGFGRWHFSGLFRSLSWLLCGTTWNPNFFLCGTYGYCACAIEIAVHRGWSSIWLECDSLSAVYCLNNSSPWQIRVRWFNCMTKLKSMNFHVSHVFREGSGHSCKPWSPRN